MSEDWQQWEFLPAGDKLSDLLKTKEGRLKIFFYIMREKIAHGLAKGFMTAGLKLPEKEQQELLCGAMWEEVMRTPAWKILEDTAQMKEKLFEFAMTADMSSDPIGEC
jgi:hypothetical protein